MKQLMLGKESCSAASHLRNTEHLLVHFTDLIKKRMKYMSGQCHCPMEVKLKARMLRKFFGCRAPSTESMQQLWPWLLSVALAPSPLRSWSPQPSSTAWTPPCDVVGILNSGTWSYATKLANLNQRASRWPSPPVTRLTWHTPRATLAGLWT